MSYTVCNLSRSCLTAVIALVYVAAPSSLVRAQSAGDVQNGKRVFEKAGCSRCHGSAGEGMSPKGNQAGPPKIAGTRLPLRDFMESVRNPKGQMPPFPSKQVSDKELSDVYAFLRSGDLSPNLVMPSSANPQNGQHLYVSFGCYECHGYQGQGSVQTGGSRIGALQDPLFRVRCVSSPADRPDAALYLESSLGCPTSRHLRFLAIFSRSTTIEGNPIAESIALPSTVVEVPYSESIVGKVECFPRRLVGKPEIERFGRDWHNIAIKLICRERRGT